MFRRYPRSAAFCRWSSRSCGLVCGLLVYSVALSGLAADVFDRHIAAILTPHTDTATPLEALSLTDAARLKSLSNTITSPCVVVRTDEGNVAKAMLSWGLRKTPGGPVPVLVIERFATYRIERPDLTTANGKEVMLFPGFDFNLDIGQVVPEGQGGDLRFTAEQKLVPVGEAKLYPLNGSLLPAPVKPPAGGGLQTAEQVVPADFNGVWTFNADGRWLGEWEITVDDSGSATGSYTSAESQSRYDLSGQLGATPHNLKLEVYLANTQMQVDAYLWTTDKSQMAGTVVLSGRKFGFVATRQPAADDVNATP